VNDAVLIFSWLSTWKASGYGDIELAVKAVKEGATDFITKPWDNLKLLATLQAALKLRLSNKEFRKLRLKQKQISEDINRNYGQIIGESTVMKDLYKTINKVASTEANILLMGENGTGKELIAHEIHRQSGRSRKDFISVDLGALSETLFESELFGHVKGAFTDAKDDRIGRFEAASEGALFLDEIGNLNFCLQAKLLSAIKNKKITPLGSNREIQVDIWIISATNKDLPAMVKESLFREDLFYRLNTVQINVPPLRDRENDLVLISEFYLSQFAGKYDRSPLKFTSKTNRDLTNFFAAVQNDDSSIIYQRLVPDKIYRNLYRSFDDINNRIRKLKIESITRNQYLQNVVDHIGIGLLSFDDNENIDILNSAAKNLVKIPAIRKLGRLEEIDKSLPGLLRELKPGEQKLIKLRVEDELLQISAKASVFKMEERKIKLISLQNIKNELEEKEPESWQKLIRILTHKILNSISPISSTIKTIKEFLSTNSKKAKSINDIEQEIIDDSVKGLNIIEERSDGLVDFVEKFRSLTLQPKPIFRQFSIKELFENIKLLMTKELNENNILLEIEVIPESLALTADKKLVEQILINLINNSIQAFDNTEDRRITLRALYIANKNVVIQVIDNGTGISDENMERIFVPFFATKYKGSGIGLSLSREIMGLHNGKIRVRSVPAVESLC
jgi:signal transduction histidine kinase